MSPRFTCRRLIQTTPPTRRLACTRSRRGGCARTCCTRAGRRVGVIAFEVVPVEAISAVNHRLASRRNVVFLQHILDHNLDPMISHATAPAKVLYCVVDTGHTRVANGLHGIACDGAHGCKRVAGTHENGISRVAKVVSTGELTLLVKAQVVAGWYWETEMGCCHCFAWCFEGHDGQAVG